MSYRPLIDFVEPAPNIEANILQFAYCDDLRVAVVHACGAGYRVVWDAHGDVSPLGDYVSDSISECQAHIQAHAPAWAEAHAQYLELDD